MTKDWRGYINDRKTIKKRRSQFPKRVGGQNERASKQAFL